MQGDDSGAVGTAQLQTVGLLAGACLLTYAAFAERQVISRYHLFSEYSGAYAFRPRCGRMASGSLILHIEMLELLMIANVGQLDRMTALPRLNILVL